MGAFERPAQDAHAILSASILLASMRGAHALPPRKKARKKESKQNTQEKKKTNRKASKQASKHARHFTIFLRFQRRKSEVTGQALTARTAVRTKKKPKTIRKQSVVQQPRAAANRSCLLSHASFHNPYLCLQSFTLSSELTCPRKRHDRVNSCVMTLANGHVHDVHEIVERPRQRAALRCDFATPLQPPPPWPRWDATVQLDTSYFPTYSVP